MAKYTPKFMALALDVLHRNTIDNPRDPNVFNRYDEDLLKDLAENGQTVAGLAEVMEMDKDKKEITSAITLQGNIRLHHICELRRRGVVNPRTGKVWDTMDVNVIPMGHLTELERHNLIHDHDKVTDLDRYATYLTFCNHFRAGLSIEQMLVKSGKLLERNFFSGNAEIPKVKIKQADGTFKDEINYTEWANKKRGRIQHLQRIFKAPTELRLAYEAQMRGESEQWLTDKDMTALLKAYNDTLKAANDGKLMEKGILPESITVDNPGPTFTELWEAKKAARAEAKTSGKRVKGVAMLNQATVTDIKDSATSKFIRAFCLVILNKRDREILGALQEALLPYESDPGVAKVLDTIMALPPTTPEEAEEAAQAAKDAKKAAKEKEAA